MTKTISGICRIDLAGRSYEFNLNAGLTIGIPLLFDGPQPNHFGAPPAKRTAFQIGGFLGDTRKNGSCNVDQISLVPHCNGTHTESIGHIVNDYFPIHSIIPAGLSLAELVTIAPVRFDSTQESYGPEARSLDLVLTAASLKAARRTEAPALVVRTLPNGQSKLAATYGDSCVPAYLTFEAGEWLVDNQVEHLLVDLPSIDRMHDGGFLYAHHRYWKVVSGGREVSRDSRTSATITEMIYVSAQIEDGLYMLGHGVAAFASDAAPSSPVLFALREVMA